MGTYFSRNTKKLSRCLHGRHNNLNLIRVLAALGVIFSHSFSITQGPDNPGTWFDRVSGNRLSVGGIAVAVFFLYSGFLIAKSCERHRKFSEFFRRRVLRIFPELALCVCLCVILAGVFVSDLTPAAYFSSPQTYRYLLNCVLFPIHTLPGVFGENPYPDVVNGSLWVLSVQFVCYLFCFAVFKITGFGRRIMLFLFAVLIAAACLYAVFGGGFMLSAVRAVLEFCLGMEIWVFRDRILLSPLIAAVSGVCFFLGCAFGYDLAAMLVFFPYLCFWFGWGTKHIFDSFSAKQDYSYGIFLWGFPVQQALVFFFSRHFPQGGAMPLWLNIVPACFVSLIFAQIGTRTVKAVRAALRRPAGN